MSCCSFCCCSLFFFLMFLVRYLLLRMFLSIYLSWLLLLCCSLHISSKLFHSFDQSIHQINFPLAAVMLLTHDSLTLQNLLFYSSYYKFSKTINNSKINSAHVYDVMRATLPTLELDAAFEAKEELASSVKNALSESFTS